MHPRGLFCIALLVLALPGTAPAVAEAATPSDWIVAADITLVREQRDIPGDVIVRPGTTLELQGTTLRIGGVLRVEAGAQLRMGPSGDAATRLVALPGGTGFWLDVEGHAQSAGLPMTLVENLSGRGLDSVIDLPGGLRINGTADLQHLHVRNGTAGLIVGPAGDLRLRDSIAENLFLMGLAVLGNATLDNATLRDNIISITGRGDCHVEVVRSNISATAGGFQMNSCRTLIRDSRVQGTNNAAFVHGPMTLTIEDSILHGYHLAGVQGEGRSTVELRNVRFLPAPGAWHGIDLKAGSTLAAENVSLVGHSQNGILAQSGRFAIRNSTLAGNGEYGLRVVQGTLQGDLATIDFGTGADRNGGGSYSLVKPVSVQYRDLEGHTLGGNLTVHLLEGGASEPVLSATGVGVVHLQPDAMHDGPDGRPVPGTDHRFLAFHPTLAGCIAGPLDLDQHVLLLNVTMASPPAVCAEYVDRLPAEARPQPVGPLDAGEDPISSAGSQPVAQWLTLALLGAGLALVVAAFVAKPAGRVLRRLRGKDP